MDDQRIIRRRATLHKQGGDAETRGLEEWEDLAAYVLLGEPGAGKSYAMRAEAKRVGGWYVTARDFTTLKLKEADVVFIDGIDEMRAGSNSHDGPLDAIRARLDAMGCPRFRLSCREADWISADQTLLAAVSPSESVTVLQLAPLNDTERAELLRSDTPDITRVSPDLEPLLGNPLLLELFAKVIGSGQMPRSRRQLYEMACESLAVEPNETMRRVRPMSGAARSALLHDAGLLCALLLISDRVGFVTGPPDAAAATLTLEDIPETLGVDSPMTALSSRLFIDTPDGRGPRHRTIAEFLAARSIAHQVSEAGLPMSRVLALTCGFDGRPTEPLRGLHAWLSVHCEKDREVLIARDPLGVVLYGDVRDFDVTSKIAVFKGLQAEAKQFAWFRSGNWQSHPFGALGTADMGAYLADLMQSSDRDSAHQAVLECALDAVETGEQVREVIPDLKRIVSDATYWGHVRSGALDAWFAQDQDSTAFGLDLLESIEQGRIEDRDDEIMGGLLSRLYPTTLSPMEALRYFHPRKDKNLFGNYQRFWSLEFVDGISSTELMSAADEILPLLAGKWRDEDASSDLQDLSGKLIARAVRESGETATPKQLYVWLGAGLDRYESARIDEKERSSIAQWLTSHPDSQKAIIALGVRAAKKDEHGHLVTWNITQRLYGAQAPRDLYLWMLQQASEAENGEEARYFLESAAYAVFHQLEAFDISLDDLGNWVSQNSQRWPEAQTWMAEVLSCKLDAYEGKHHRESKDRKAKTAEQDQTRRAQFAPYIKLIRDGSAPAGVLHQVAFAYQKRFYDIDGDTPEARVAHLLGVDLDEARQCINGLEFCLTRDDVPNVDEIIKLDLEDRYHLLRPACLLGLRSRFERGEDFALTLPLARFEQLFAFALTDGTDEVKPWVEFVMRKHPQQTAPVFIRYAKAKIARNPERHITGLWELRKEGDEGSPLSGFGKLVLPSLLGAVPLRATEKHVNLLNRTLLPAAHQHLSRSELEVIVDGRLERSSLGFGQKLAWLATGLHLNPKKYISALATTVGANQKRAAALGNALSEQSTRSRSIAMLPVQPLAALIELLGPQTTPKWRTKGFARNSNSRSEFVREMVSQLASSTGPDAGMALNRLRTLPQLAHWKTHLDGAMNDHTRSARAANFIHPTPEQIGSTFANNAPANAQDLASLTMDRLGDLQEHLRHAEFNTLVQFWRAEDDGTPVPRTENECRDVLLQMLRPSLLQSGVQLEKESYAANEKRADLRVSAVTAGERVVVPIEIKKDDHRELFVAWQQQLEGLYAIDPYAQRTGIYLVLWFGRDVRTSTAGKRVADASAMLEALKSASSVGNTSRIHFFVLDLSRPIKQPRSLSKKSSR